MSHPAPRRSPLLRPAVLAPVLLLLAVGVGYGVVQWLAAAERAEARQRVLADVDATLAAEPVDTGSLSRLVAVLQKLPDHTTARDLLAAQARIELARDRPERAQELFLVVAGQPGASPAEQGLGARILLRVHEAGAPDPATAAGWLVQAIELASASYRESRSPGDLLRAWQAAERAGQTDRAREFAQALAADHADTREARFVAFAVAFGPGSTPAAVGEVLAAWAEPPAEGAAMRAFAQLQAGDVPAAVQTVEAALARAPGVGVVRWAAAVVFHACVAGSPAGSVERARWVGRRDAQLDWVAQQPGLDEARARQVAQMRDVR